jgi:predicted nucleotide-binding protein
MEKTEILERLAGFKARLVSDVIPAYSSRGSEFGRERFAAWRRQLTKFLDERFPGQTTTLNAKLHHSVMFRGRSESDLDVFMRMDGNACLAFLDSLTIDVQNDEFDFSPPQVEEPPPLERGTIKPSSRVFIVHGHDELLLTKAARFVERLGLEPVILHEQASKGMTIIEKIEANTDVGFAIVLYTPDDKGNTASEADAGNLNCRARQNVVFEHGYLIAKLKRSHVVPLMAGSIETPSDISGIVYVDDSNWQVDIAKEMMAAGYEIDFNRLLRP